MTDSPALPPVIRTHADLTAMWHHLVSPTAAQPLTLALAFFGSDTGADSGTDLTPATMVCLDDVPSAPGLEDAVHLRALVEEVRRQVEGDSVAAALVRSGGDRVGADDRAWGRYLAEHVGLTERWPVHLVTPAGARVLAADDLIGPERTGPDRRDGVGRS